ncbi:MAG: hypothetical protein SP1CHLAM54_17480 [Chlamydiia bacterium]|nr:hypothetical protein [Chlamydiia bacterium]MCH9616636.1 hypothetical protein [Chlamydiia bacterium]MCH9629367.1 hypothetical protein [Chlamydiia bacterium]
MSLDKFKDDFILLCEAGFIAVNQADEDTAMKLFEAAKALEPEHHLPKIGEGYLHFHKLELKRACAIFEKVLEEDGNNEMARAFLGMALSLTPDMGEHGKNILSEVAEKASDKNTKTVAKETIDFVETFIEKKGTSKPSPMDLG